MCQKTKTPPRREGGGGIEKDQDRREGKGRCCYMFGGRIRLNSLSHLLFSTWMNTVESRLLGRMDALKKLMMILFTPYQTTTLPTWMFIQKYLFKASLLVNGLCGIPPPTATTFCLFFCLYPSSMERGGGREQQYM